MVEDEELGAGLVADFDQVAKALGDDEGMLGALPFQKGCES